MTRPAVRVLLVDDHPVYRLGLRALLDSTDGFEVVGEADTGTAAIAAFADLDPDVVVMDLRMPDLNGIEATKSIVGTRPSAAVLVLTYSDEDHSLIDAVLAGARGYVLKDAGKDAILRAVADVAAGGMVLGASIAQRLPDLLAGEDSPAQRRLFPQLTDRELEVLELMARGVDNRQIAVQLGIGDKRVRNCVSQIYNKLAVTDRSQAILVARDAGMGTRT